MTSLSIIIVNYNVRYFLELCLQSVLKACKGIEAEIIVVDNASTDGSKDYIPIKFPDISYFYLEENLGFSKANNYGINKANGEFILLLNPDTIVGENTFATCLSFMKSHPEAGAMGIKMLDGKGEFLPESKRGLPTPWVSFCKIVGLSALFSQSKIFGGYHLGYLNRHKNHRVPVLSGAFMFLKKDVLKKSGLLDEDYFMYGEDIDFSYRIEKAGYYNYYLADDTIIHFKGESTKKASLNYVRMFHEAMAIFVSKHFSSGYATAYAKIIKAAIFFKAISSGLSRVLAGLIIPFFDALILFFGLVTIKNFWGTQVKNIPDYYPELYTYTILPAYVFLWLLSLYFNSAYDKPYKPFRAVRGVLIGTVFIATLYAFLPEAYRFSRAVILIGSFWGVLSLSLFRTFITFRRERSILTGTESSAPRLAIIGNRLEAERCLRLLAESQLDYRFIGFISVEENFDNQCIGSWLNFNETIAIFRITEVVCCMKDIPADTLIKKMEEMHSQINFKFLAEGAEVLISSHSKNIAGDLYGADTHFSLTTPANIRNKRLFDVISASLLLLLFPVLLPFTARKKSLFWACIKVLLGHYTWVGYRGDSTHLPILKPSVFPPYDINIQTPNPSVARKINHLYARDYNVFEDFLLLAKNWRNG